MSLRSVSRAALAFAPVAAPVAALAFASASGTALAEGHVTATNCEIFIDKITPYASSHAFRGANLWVKVLPGRLDGAIVEVGFRNAQRGSNWNGPTSRDWANDRLGAFFGATDYFQTNLPFGSDFGSNNYVGAFYLKTDKETYYWAKSPQGDFTFDRNTYNNVMNVKGVAYNYSGAIDQAVPTQQAGMEYFNPQGCR